MANLLSCAVLQAADLRACTCTHALTSCLHRHGRGLPFSLNRRVRCFFFSFGGGGTYRRSGPM